MMLGGMTALERVLFDLATGGVGRAIVACEPITLRTDIPVAVQWALPGASPPAGATRVRGDEIMGIVVTDERSRRKAEWALLKSLPKSFQGPIDALVNWRFSLRLTRLLAPTSIRPNHVTFAATAVGLFACWLALTGTRASVAVAGLLLQLHSILDSCDGELARLKHQKSRLGQWLDNVTDDVIDNLFIACAGLGAGGLWAVVGVGGAAARVLASLAIYIHIHRRTGTGDVYAFRWWFEREKTTIEDVYNPRSPLTYLRALGRRDTYVLIFCLLCLAGRPQTVAVYGAVAGATTFILLLLHLAATP
jgi:phosphatidylglycerophosphate synthase